MPFEINENLHITGRRADSANFTFEFEEDISDCTLVFQVKKNEGDSDERAIIRKELKGDLNNSVTFELTPSDTNKLICGNEGHTTYRWGLKIYRGTEFAQTLIPQEHKPAPKMHIHPAIVERCENA